MSNKLHSQLAEPGLVTQDTPWSIRAKEHEAIKELMANAGMLLKTFVAEVEARALAIAKANGYSEATFLERGLALEALKARAKGKGDE